MDSTKALKLTTEAAAILSSGNQTSERLHITAKGRQGKALRKKLAIAMGLRVSSSGTPSTVDSDEELEEDNSKNVMEMFRKQMKMTASQRKQTSKVDSNTQQVLNDASSVLFRRTVSRKRTTRTDYVDGEEDDIDYYQERSRDHTERSSNSRRSRNTITKNTLDKSIEEKKNINERNNTTRQQTDTIQQQTNTIQQQTNNIRQQTNTIRQQTNTTPQHTNTAPQQTDTMQQQTNTMQQLTNTIRQQTNNIQQQTDTTRQQTDTMHQLTNTTGRTNENAISEEIFTSFGEQNESSSATQSSPVDSVKLLREKIRKNARARKLPRPVGVGVTGTGRNSKDAQSINEIQRKLSVSQIPIRVVRKTSNGSLDSQNEKKEKPVQKSKIPRKISQTSSDRNDSEKKSGLNIDSGTLLSEILHDNDNTEKDALKLDLMKETRSSEFHQDTVDVDANQELQTNYDSLFDLETFDTDDFKKERNQSSVSGSKVENTLTRLNTRDTSLTNQSTSTNVKIRHSSSNKTTYDFDTLLSEIEKLKVSVYKTYDDFHEMKEFTLNLSKELKQYRNI